MTTGVEDVKVTQRMAIDALADYLQAHEDEKKAKATKAALSKAILKPWLEANPNATLYDGEHEIEASLQPFSAPRWLDWQGIDVHLLMYAVQNQLLTLNLGQVDKFSKNEPSSAFVKFKDRVKPGGTGTPRLHVGPKEE